MISTKGRYAIRLMQDLAEQNSDKPVPLSETANRQQISKKYLEAIAKTLVSAKLLKATSGKGGGYSLARKPKDYTLYEILKATEESMTSVACLMDDADPCPREHLCKTISIWRGYDKVVKDYFSNITLQDMIYN